MEKIPKITEGDIRRAYKRHYKLKKCRTDSKKYKDFKKQAKKCKDTNELGKKFH